jgi:hypothetical protein
VPPRVALSELAAAVAPPSPVDRVELAGNTVDVPPLAGVVVLLEGISLLPPLQATNAERIATTAVTDNGLDIGVSSWQRGCARLQLEPQVLEPFQFITEQQGTSTSARPVEP